MKNWKTTLAGLVLAVLGGLQLYGVKIGHVGSGDYVGLLQTIVGLALGVYAKDPSKDSTNLLK